MVLIAYPFIQNFIIGHEETIFFPKKQQKKNLSMNTNPASESFVQLQKCSIKIFLNIPFFPNDINDHDKDMKCDTQIKREEYK